MNLELDNEHVGVNEEGLYVDIGKAISGQCDIVEDKDSNYGPGTNSKFEADSKSNSLMWN